MEIGTGSLWVEKYRPKVLADCLLPDDKRKVFEGFVRSGELPNMLLCSRSPGTGKTTIAKAMCNELGADFMMLNGSLHGNIDTLRNDITQYAMTSSFDGKRKYVILDEADALTLKTQDALRNFIEESSENCGFILTANYEGGISEPIKSRCVIHHFDWNRTERAIMSKELMKRLSFILTTEGIEFDKQTLAHVILRHFPDMRKMIGILQNNVMDGKLMTSALAQDFTDKVHSLIDALKAGDFKEMRKWVSDNPEVDMSELNRAFDKLSTQYLKPASIPEMILIMADYQFKHGFVADKELNVTAMLTEFMTRLDYV